MRKLTLPLSMLLLAGLCLPALPATAQEGAAKKPLSLYRLEFALHELEDGKRVNTRNYMQLVEEGGGCAVRAGHKVAISTVVQGQPSTQYLDVGFRLDCRLSESDGYVRLEYLRLDMTSFAEETGQKERPLLRNISSEARTAVLPGKPTVVSSIDDSASQRRYELEVTATKAK